MKEENKMEQKEMLQLRLVGQNWITDSGWKLCLCRKLQLDGSMMGKHANASSHTTKEVK